MKTVKRVLYVLLCFCLLTAAAPCAAFCAWDEGAGACAGGVFRVVVTVDFYRSDGSYGGTACIAGTGFIVGEGESSAAVITNAHICTEELLSENLNSFCERYGLKYYRINGPEVIVNGDVRISASVIGYSRVCDFAVLELDRRVYSDSILKFRKEPALSGEKVFSIGYPETFGTDLPGAAEQSASGGGTVSMLSETEAGVSVILHCAKADGGVFCGPLLDENGAVLGINSSLLKTDGGDACAVSAGELTAVLDTLGVSYGVVSAGAAQDDGSAGENGVFASVPVAMWVLLGVLILMFVAAFTILLAAVFKMRNPVYCASPKPSAIPAADSRGVERKFVSPNSVPAKSAEAASVQKNPPVRKIYVSRQTESAASPAYAGTPGEEPPCGLYPDASPVRRMEISQSAPVQAIPVPPVYEAAQDSCPAPGDCSEYGGF